MEMFLLRKCFGGSEKEEKKKPMINVTQAIQLNQEEGEVKEKEMPATKPPEIIKKQLETILEELEKQEYDVEEFIDISNRRADFDPRFASRLKNGSSVAASSKQHAPYNEEEEEEIRNNFFVKYLDKLEKDKAAKVIESSVDLYDSFPQQ